MGFTQFIYYPDHYKGMYPPAYNLFQVFIVRVDQTLKIAFSYQQF